MKHVVPFLNSYVEGTYELNEGRKEDLMKEYSNPLFYQHALRRRIQLTKQQQMDIVYRQYGLLKTVYILCKLMLEHFRKGKIDPRA